MKKNNVLIISLVLIVIISMIFVYASDVKIADLVSASYDYYFGYQGVYWINTTHGVFIYPDANLDLAYKWTTDGGQTWSNTIIYSGTIKGKISAYFDQQNINDDGTLVHIGWIDNTDMGSKYVTINISDGTYGNIYNISTNLTYSASQDAMMSVIGKSDGGYLYYLEDVFTGSVHHMDSYISEDGGMTWNNSITDILETSTTANDWSNIYPSNTGNNEDICIVYMDRTSNQLTIKYYNYTTDSVTETLIVGGLIDSEISFESTLRHSDGHILVSVHTDDNFATDDLLFYDINCNASTPTITQKTNIFTNTDDSLRTSVMINQQNDDIYVGYIRGSSALNFVKVYYKKSTDDGDTWGDEMEYSNISETYIRAISSGKTIGFYGGRIDFIYLNSNIHDTFISNINTINISAGSDIVYPDVLILSPSQQKYDTTTIWFNVSANDSWSGMDTCTYSLDGASNISMSNSSDIYYASNTSMTQGSHTINYYCNDTVGNLNNIESYTFLIDSIAPDVVITKNTSQVAYINGSINIIWNVTDDNLNYTLFNITYPNGTILYSSTASNGDIILDADNLTITGTFTINLWANDTINNINSTSGTFDVALIQIQVIGNGTISGGGVSECILEEPKKEEIPQCQEYSIWHLSLGILFALMCATLIASVLFYTNKKKRFK